MKNLTPSPALAQWACILSAWVGLAGSAVESRAATTIFQGSHVDLQASTPVTVGSGAEQLWMVTLTAVGKGGALVGGFDGFMSGPLHHQTVSGQTTPSLSEPVAGTTLATNLDSHFLVQNSQILSIQAPTESYGPRVSLEVPNATGASSSQAIVRFNDKLNGAFAMLSGSQANWTFVQLVAPRGAEILLDFSLGFGGPDAPAPEFVEKALLFDDTLLTGLRCGDLDSDFDVDSADLLGFLANWTGDAPGPGFPVRAFGDGDCDRDGDIDSNDLLGFLENWTGSQESSRAALQSASLASDVSSSAAVASVPEPATSLAWLSGTLATLFVAGRRRRA